MFSLLDLSALQRRITLLRNSYHQVFSLFGLTSGCSATTLCLCVGRFTGEAFLRNFEAAVEPCATGLRVPRHLGNAIGRPMPGLGSPGLGTEELLATSLRMCWHLEFAIGRQTPSVLQDLPQLAHGSHNSTLSCSSFLINDGDSLLFQSQE